MIVVLFVLTLRWEHRWDFITRLNFVLVLPNLRIVSRIVCTQSDWFWRPPNFLMPYHYWYLSLLYRFLSDIFVDRSYAPIIDILDS